MTARGSEDPLEDLGRKIEAVRAARAPKPRSLGGKWSGAGFGWRMTVDLATGIGVGAAMGWGLDSLTGARPVFLILMTMLGFAAGVRVMMGAARDYQAEQVAAAARNDATPDTGATKGEASGGGT